LKHLGNAAICGAAYPVLEGNASDEEVLGTANGVCKTEERQIWIHEGLTKAKAEDTLTHEVLHAINADSGLLYAIAAALGCHEDDTRLMPMEEMMVRILTPHIRAAFGPPKLGKPGR